MLHVSNLFRSFIVSFKYDLILLRYSSNDSFYFYHHYFHIQYNSYFKSNLFLLVCNCLLFLTHKICWYLELFCLFFYCLIFFFKSKKISDILHCDVIFFFFYLLLFSSRSGIIHIFSKLLDICDIIFLPYTVSGRRFLGDSTQYASPSTGSQICHLFNVCL